jgi:hypothetical protein
MPRRAKPSSVGKWQQSTDIRLVRPGLFAVHQGVGVAEVVALNPPKAESNPAQKKMPRPEEGADAKDSLMMIGYLGSASAVMATPFKVRWRTDPLCHANLSAVLR